MGRINTGKAQGRASTFTGEKKTWLESFHDDLLAAEDPGTVYTDCTNRWFLRYGYELPLGQNVVGNPEDNPPVIDPNPSEEEKARRRELRASFRTKIGNWFRNRYRGKKVHAATIKKILNAMQSMTGRATRPRVVPAVVMYSKLHYATRLKPAFDLLWAEAKKTHPANARLAMSQDYLRDCWAKESVEFQQEVEEQAAETHRVEMEEWKATKEVLQQSAENYHDAFETLDEVAIPMADALAERLGQHVIILMVGPVGSAKGEVSLTSVFSDTTGCRTSKTWPKFDHVGFTAMEASVTRFGRALYSRADCAQRAWPPLEGVEIPPLNGLLTIDQNVSAPPPPVAPLSSVNPVDAKTPAAAPASLTAALDTLIVPVAPIIPIASIIPVAPIIPVASDTSTPNTTLSSTIGPTLSAPASGEPPVPDDGIDRTDWAPSLISAHAYFIQKRWGAKWSALIEALVTFEWSHYHHEERSKLFPGQCRPAEFPSWFKHHRIYDDFPIAADFGKSLKQWWVELGPKTRWDNVGDGEGQTRTPEHPHSAFRSGLWSRLNTTSGRNGPALIVLGLAWWGQRICNDAAGDGLGAGEAALDTCHDWQILVEDVKWVLENMLTQGRTEMEEFAAGKEREREEEKEEPEREPGEEQAVQPKKTKGKAPRKSTTAKSALKKVEKDKDATQKPAARKRKRAAVDEEPDEMPASKKQSLPVPRPKPQRLTRNALARRAEELQEELRSGMKNLPLTSTSGSPESIGKPSAAEGTGTEVTAGNEGAGIASQAVAVSSQAASQAPTPNPAESAIFPPATRLPDTDISLLSIPTSHVDSTNTLSSVIASGQNDVIVLNESTGKNIDLELDPFADLSGLTEEERYEMSMDPDADEEEEEGAEDA
ncbi:hypothetical protein C8R43DRAFT_1117840 [Mycena crocata]|nr:hypothetical protein C8R43DRAFT_1117840 [Mycena crocata]